MSPEAQRIAIAEACGWTNIHKFDKWQEGGPSSTKEGDVVGDSEGITRRHLPGYLNDLNAMHEAEKTLTPGHYQDYYRLLSLAIVTGGMHPGAWHSTAAQRAEAFLRTIGKWVEP